jgi:pyruvate kinase
MGAAGNFTGVAEAWNREAVESLIGQLSSLRAVMVALEAGLGPQLRGVEPTFAASARNLAYYLALRRIDIRPLQERLA